MKHLKILTTLLFASFLVENGYSQTFEWLKTHPIDYNWNPDYLLTSTTTTTDGSVYFFGMHEFSLNYGIAAFGSLYLDKFDSDGNLFGSHIIEGEAAVTGIFSDADGNIFLFGQYHSEIDFWGQLTLQMNELSINHFFVKIDENGNILWGMNTDNLNEFFQNFFDAIVDGEGNIYIGYDTWSDSYISKLNSDGEVISTILQEDVTNISGLALDGEGNLIVAGSCAGLQSVFNGTPMPAPFTYTNYLAKYNAEMELSWVKFVEDITCTFSKVVVDNNNNIYWSGPMFIGTAFDELQSEGPSWVYDFFLVKLNASGEYLWLREVPEVVSGDASTGNLDFLEIKENGNVILGGFTRGDIEWDEGIVSVSNGLNLDVIVWEFNTDGAVNWVKTAGGDARDQAQAISYDGNGNVYISGTAGSTVSFDSIIYESEDFAYPFLAKLNTETTTSINVKLDKSDLVVYPNPAYDIIHFNQSNIKNITITNLAGQVVYQAIVNNNNTTLNIHGLKTGLYFIVLETEEGMTNRSTFIKK